MKSLVACFVVWLFLAQLSKMVTSINLYVEGSKSTSDTTENCNSDSTKGNCHLHFDKICKDQEATKEFFASTNFGKMAVCNEKDFDFAVIKKFAKSIFNGEKRSNVFEEMYPFKCESSEDSVQSGIGVILLKNGQLNAAITHYTNLIEGRDLPSCPLWYFGRAMVYDKLGLTESSNLAKALSDYTNALNLVDGEDAVKVYEARAELFTSLGQHEQAFKDCTSAISISPSFNLYLRRGISLVFMEKFSAAYADLQESLRLFPHQATAMHYSATCLFHMRRLNEAINTFEAVLVLKPHDTDVMLSLAQAHRELGDFDKALSYLNKASLLQPTNPLVHRRKGQLLYDHGNVAAALVAFRNCVSLEPFNSDCSLMVAKCHANTGQFYPAIKELTKITQGFTIQDNQGTHIYPATMYLREWCRYVHHRLDTSLELFDVEKDIHEGFKENWTRDSTCSLYNYTEQPGLQPHIKDLTSTPWDRQPRSIQKLLCFAFNQGKTLHAQGARFADNLVGNVRAYLASGLASVEIMQTLPYVWKNQEKVGKTKIEIFFGWKDIFDIAIKWIRFVDLDKPLFWVDETFTHTKPFLHRFALIHYNQTRLKYEKYYSKFHHALLQQCDKLASAYDDSIEPEENFARLFAREQNCKKPNDYIMVSNKIGSKKEGLKNQIDGCLLGLQLDKDNKVNLVMEIDLNRLRVKRMHKELDFIWARVADEYYKYSAGVDPQNGPDHVINWMISLSYYFLNLMPLSHSSTIVSHTTAVGLIAAIGRESVGQITAGKDLLLEALTINEQEKFRSNLRSWLSFKKFSSFANDQDNVAQSFPDFRSMMTIMQYDLTTLCRMD